jgi:Asp/Glu/hydantoin racemase
VKKKILIQRIAASDPASVMTKRYENLLLKNVKMVKEEDTQVTLRLLKRGLNKLSEFAYSYLHYLNDREVFEAVIQGEKDGFDAIIVYCFSDPALDEMKQAVQIPVIGLGQSSMILASLMGAKIGCVAMSPASVGRNEELARKYGFINKLILPIRHLPLSLDEQAKMIKNARAGIDAFKKVASEYILNGAEVLVAACGALNLALRFCPGCKEYKKGFTEFNGVPIVDSVAAAIKMAEMLIAIKRAGSAWISRKGIYSRPSKKLNDDAISKLGYKYGGTI